MAKIKTNQNQLVKIAIQGKISNADQFGEFEISHAGVPFSVPSTGGIVYNVKVGDRALGWAGDHIEPGVSVLLDPTKRSSRSNMGFNFLACIGNKARIVSGDAKGALGVVTGHHGGVEHVLVDFEQEVLEKMTLDDRILIEGYGQGLVMKDIEGIKVYSVDPDLFGKLPIKVSGKNLQMGVTTIIPAALMGSGMGHNNIATGDCDVMTHDAKEVKRLKLDKLCFGDLVAITDHDHSFGRTFRTGAVTIGVVVHSDSLLAGHGPGISTIMTSARGRIKPVLDTRANIARILKIGKYR